MADFIKLCEKIIDSNGNPSVQNVLDCGFSMDNFLQLCNPNMTSERLVKNAKRALKDRGINYG